MQNIEINPNMDDNRITSSTIALGNLEGNMDFYCPILGHEGVGGLKDTQRAPLEEVVKVEVKTLNNFVSENNIEKIDFIKLDVEGGEFDVLRGGIEIIRKMKPVILFEATDLNTSPYGYKVTDLLSYLKQEGFIIKTIDRENFIAVPSN
jgi:FkbM family methyltransferase